MSSLRFHWESHTTWNVTPLRSIDVTTRLNPSCAWGWLHHGAHTHGSPQHPRWRAGRQYPAVRRSNSSSNVSSGRPDGCMSPALAMHNKLPSVSPTFHPDTREPTKNFHLTLHQVYRQPQEATEEQLNRLEALTLARIDELNADALLTVMYAFARTPWAPRTPQARMIMQRFIDSSAASLSTFAPRQLYMTAWSLDVMQGRLAALLGATQPYATQEWVKAMEGAFEGSSSLFSATELVDTLVPAVRLGCSVPAPTLATLQEWVGRQAVATASPPPPPGSNQASPVSLSLNTPHVFSAALWLLGHAGRTVPSRTLPAVVQHASLLLRSATEEEPPAAEDVVHLLCGLASQAPQTDAQLLPIVLNASEAAMRHLGGEHRQLAQLSWALAKLGVRPNAEWGHSFCNLLLERLEEAQPGDIVGSILAMVGLGFPLPASARPLVSAYMRSHVYTEQQERSLALVGISLHSTG